MIVIVNGIYKFGLPTQVQTIAYGAVIIIMSVFDSIYMRMSKKKLVVSKKVSAGQEG